MDKFLIATNPMSGNDCEVIVRTVEPKSYYYVHDGHIAVKGTIYRHYVYGAEKYTISIGHYFTTVGVEQIAENLAFVDEKQAQEADIYKKIDDAWHWYCALLKWEDGQDD